MKKELRLTESFFFRGHRGQKNFVRKEIRRLRIKEAVYLRRLIDEKRFPNS